MKCGACGARNSRGTGACGFCGALLIRPADKGSPETAVGSNFVALPHLSPSDSVVVESLLRGAGIPFTVSLDGGVAVRREDYRDVKELLSDLDVRLSDRIRGKIAW